MPVPAGYAPEVLRGVPRALGRERGGLAAAPPFDGEDLWRAYELTWLGPEGRPRIGVLTLRVPCRSPRLVESKSLKLYLGGFAQSRFDAPREIERTIAADLAAVLGCQVSAQVAPPSRHAAFGALSGDCLDDLPARIERYEVCATLLAAAPGFGEQAVYTHLFRSMCPITGQPDCGSISIAWRGRRLVAAGVLAYLVSYRTSAGFHEEMVERIFADIHAATAPTMLAVQGWFLRRGGIDINPSRHMPAGSSPAAVQREASSIRLPRQ